MSEFTEKVTIVGNSSFWENRWMVMVPDMDYDECHDIQFYIFKDKAKAEKIARSLDGFVKKLVNNTEPELYTVYNISLNIDNENMYIHSAEELSCNLSEISQKLSPETLMSESGFLRISRIWGRGIDKGKLIERLKEHREKLLNELTIIDVAKHFSLHKGAARYFPKFAIKEVIEKKDNILTFNDFVLNFATKKIQKKITQWSFEGNRIDKPEGIIPSGAGYGTSVILKDVNYDEMITTPGVSG